MRNDVIELVTQYKDGKELKENTVQIFARKKSLGRNEFYAAFNVGLRCTHIFIIFPSEYYLADANIGDKTYHATHVRYKNQLFEIVRTYEASPYSMELTVS